MKRRDFLIMLAVPSVLIVLPLIGSLTVDGWNWKWNDFLAAWTIFAVTTAFFRLLVLKSAGNWAYQAAAALAVLTGFLITWVTMAVQIIGEDNPGNGLYLLTVLGGLIGVLVARFRPAGLSLVAFGMSAALLVIPAVAVIRWPADFSPGYARIQFGSAVLAAIYATAGLLFRRAARITAGARTCSQE